MVSIASRSGLTPADLARELLLLALQHLALHAAQLARAIDGPERSLRNGLRHDRRIEPALRHHVVIGRKDGAQITSVVDPSMIGRQAAPDFVDDEQKAAGLQRAFYDVQIQIEKRAVLQDPDGYRQVAARAGLRERARIAHRKLAGTDIARRHRAHVVAGVRADDLAAGTLDQRL